MPQVNIRIESVGEEEQQTGVPSQKKTEKGGAKIAAASIFAHQAISTAKSLVGTYVNNIGLYTNDYVKQDNIQRQLEGIGTVIGIGAAFATNWVAGLAMVAGTAIKGIADYSIIQKNIEIENQRTEYLKQRNGNTLEDGSRRRWYEC